MLSSKEKSAFGLKRKRDANPEQRLAQNRANKRRRLVKAQKRLQAEKDRVFDPLCALINSALKGE